ncbi:MAG: hypothetical protein IJZ74_00970 [Clostridia bacterium]|nr:hypothetical protein [Clostridia bacterium]
MNKLLTLLLALTMLLTTCCACAESSTAAEDVADVLDTIWGNKSSKTIAPFLDFTWGEALLYGNECRSKTALKRKTSVYEYTVNLSTSNISSFFSGMITAKTESQLEYVWRNLGQECIKHYDEYEEIDPTDNGLIAYQFTNDDTYLRFEYISSRYDDYILFVLIH